VHGRKGVQDFWQGARDNGVQQILLHLGDVELRGSDTLIEVSTATITAGGSQIPVKYVVVWTREGDGSWRLHVDMWSRTKPAELPTGP
jgi:ketosteroid isomerase-like protein